MTALMVEHFGSGWSSPAEILRALDKAASDLADEYGIEDQFGMTAEAQAANATAMARAGGPAKRRPPKPKG